MFVHHLRRWPNIRPTLAECVVLNHDTAKRDYPANIRHWANAGLLVGQRRRRWANSKPTLAQRLMFAGIVVLNRPYLADIVNEMSV